MKPKQEELNDALLRAIVEGSDDAIISKDLNSTITSWNPAAGQIFGYTAEEAIGQPVTMLFPDELIEEEDEILTRIRNGEKIDHYETVRQRKDGTLLEVSLTISPIRNSEGDIVGASKIARDISKRKQKELNNALLSAIVEGSDDAIISKDLNSTITSWNPGAERIFGYTAEETIGQPVTLLFPDELIEEEDEIINRIRNGERIDHYETVRQRKDGTLLDVSLTISPIRDSQGDIVGASKIARDITQHKQNREKREQLLREVEAERKRLSEVFQNAPSFMCILQGPDHVFERANDFYYKLVGDRPIIGKPVREAVPEAAEQGFIDMLDQVYQTGEPISATDERILLEQGKDKPPRERYLDFVYQPYRNSQGKVVGIFVQGVDLTERKQAKEQLQELNATLEERVKERTSALLSYQDQLRSLAAQLSKAEEKERHRLATELHDNLGQMLAVCKMRMDLLPQDQLAGRVAAEIEEIKQGMNDALVYTRDLMSDLKPPPTLDKEDVRATIEWLAQKMEKHELNVLISDDQQPKRTSEEIRTTILQCVREIFFNIVKHSGVKEAAVNMSRENNEIHIVVEDEGRGFDPDSQNLEPTDNGGFGLFNIRERIDLMGGSIDISSKPGEGTKIAICAPLYEEELAEIPEKPVVKNASVAAKKSSPKIKVLLADDHQLFREGVKKLIQDEEDMMVIGEASTGEEAVQLAGETSPDIIMMDVSMPVMNGIEASREILSFLPEVRIIGLSSLDDYEGVKKEMLEAGAAAYLAKGEATETLCATIRSEARLVKSEE